MMLSWTERWEIELLEEAARLARRATVDLRYTPREWARIYRTAAELLEEASGRRRRREGWHKTRRTP